MNIQSKSIVLMILVLSAAALAATPALALGGAETDARAGDATDGGTPEPAGAGFSRVQSFVESLEPGRAATCGRLTVVPLHRTGGSPSADGLLTLEEALEKRMVVIREKDGGTVPRLILTNRSQRPVYIMGGEILSGGKQDRIVARDVIVGPRKSGVSLPVYCVEHGRWTGRTEKFYSKQNLGTHELRSNAQAGKSRSQEKIWRKIDETNRSLGVESDTSAYQDAYDHGEIRDSIEEAERRLLSLPEASTRVVGVVVCVDGEIVSIDLFASSALFRRLWPKILRAAMTDALTVPSMGAGAEAVGTAKIESLVEAHLAALGRQGYTVRAAVDQGKELSHEDDALTTGALVFEGEIIHLASFPAPAEEDQSQDRIGRVQGINRQHRSNRPQRSGQEQTSLLPR